MPHVAASQKAAPAAHKAEAQASIAPGEPTVREPALERRREREERNLVQTLQLGSTASPELLAKIDPAPSSPAGGALSPGSLGTTQRLGSSASSHGHEHRAAVDSAESPERSHGSDAEKPPARHPEHGHDALHDQFFDAGEQGFYEGGQEQQPGFAEELEADEPRFVVRTPEQEQRRSRMTQVVGILVGVALGVFVFALMHSRASNQEKTNTESQRPTAPRQEPIQPTEPAPPVQAAPSPAEVPPPPPPSTETPPEPEPAEPATNSQDGASSSSAERANKSSSGDTGSASRPRRPGEPPAPASPHEDQPRRPVLPMPAGKPPTASFPD
jgi:hypothetical protein